MDKSKIRILTGDDHLLSRRLVLKQLEVMGFANVTSATNGDEVLALLDKESFDVVILDWVMPVRTGVEVLKMCRAQEKFAKTAFVMLSAEAHDNMIKEAMDAGAAAYIVKPVTQAVFTEKMDAVLAWLDRKRGAA